jgi:deoxyadenosine/deoxycytidine kinase
MSRYKVIIVEGLIGSGKTTLSRELGAALGEDTLTLYEPDEKGGQNQGGGNSYLADYYKDPQRWAFAMQAHLLQARFRMHLQAQWYAMQGAGHAILDRSYFGDTAFARLQLKLETMSQREFDTYSSLYHAMTASVLLPNVCVRVLASPEVCARRIKGRMEKETGRVCEDVISLDYLRELDRETDHMVSVLQSMGVTILNVPWDIDRESPEDRAPAVEALSARIKGMKSPVSGFLDLHRRTV